MDGNLLSLTDFLKQQSHTHHNTLTNWLSYHLTLSVLEVLSPERPNLVLSTDIPHYETHVLVLYTLLMEIYTNDSSEHFQIGYHHERVV